MESLPGATAAGERLKATSLRDFGPPVEGEVSRTSYKVPVDPVDTPVPALWRYALTLIGLESHGPGEKVAWWVNFSYKGEPCTLTDEKFGVRLYLTTTAPDPDARAAQILKQLRSSMRTVEGLILSSAPDLLSRGDATVRNQHTGLSRAYEYFRERAESPSNIPDEHESGVSPGGGTWSSFKSGAVQMQLNSFHDMVAAISAYLSRLEHDLVLALPFSGFDPAADDLTGLIGSRWGEKWQRVLGSGKDAARYRERLAEVVERWRNPYSHGGFEKGHTASIWLHAPGLAAAVPVGMTDVRRSPHFSFLPADEGDIADTFALFDEIDAWLDAVLPEAMEWCRSGLNVRFDEDFRKQVSEARMAGEFAVLLEGYEYRQDMIDNMDY